VRECVLRHVSKIEHVLATGVCVGVSLYFNQAGQRCVGPRTNI